MNSWFQVGVKYTKQLDDGTFKRVSEPYLIAAMTFSDAEQRTQEELGALVRGEFLVTAIKRADVHDIFHYEDSDTWFKCTIKFESGDGGEEGQKAKKVTQIFLVSAHSVKEAYDRLNESLGGTMIDFKIPSVALSPIVDIFPFGDEGEEEKNPAEKLREALGASSVVITAGKTVFSASGSDIDEEEDPLWDAERLGAAYGADENGIDGEQGTRTAEEPPE